MVPLLWVHLPCNNWSPPRTAYNDIDSPLDQLRRYGWSLLAMDSLLRDHLYCHQLSLSGLFSEHLCSCRGYLMSVGVCILWPPPNCLFCNRLPIIYPRRACAERVTVIVSCVCVSVCMSVCTRYSGSTRN